MSNFFNETLLQVTFLAHTGSWTRGPDFVVITGLGLGAALRGPHLPSPRELH